MHGHRAPGAFAEWQRAVAFPGGGESRERAIAREVKLIRNGVGVYDASPLGKIELIGSDALDFADRFYINDLTTLEYGRARYGIMLRAKSLHQQLEVAFEGSTFRATNVSQALARIEVQGPETRALLLKGCSLDLHPSRFPPGRCARTRFAALPTVLRCTGPTNFECIITASYKDYLLSWLADAAEEVLE